jgi:protein-L-isoaspartate(D-aspartate) O-methyltransferase
MLTLRFLTTTVNSNEQLVDYLVKRDYIESEEIEEAFREVDRADFVEKNPYIDRPASKTEGSTVSAPSIVAMMLELLEPEGKVLEMGSGSGYVLALLEELAEEVVGVERIETLVKESREKVPEAEVILGDSLPDREFDRILFSFAAEEETVEKAVEKAEIVVAPVIKDDGQILKKFKEGESEKETRVRFVEEREGLREDKQ